MMDILFGVLAGLVLGCPEPFLGVPTASTSTGATVR
ncbi:hypothetical protein F4560_003661 [Saccharothrix ecbatanensis]|uniref:Uncharacterized protein n=1 Tax=Saccharothrix ecbatanensis TaxID=1105145 RepID=A0A7W9M1I4_9PSEU|nr:hypothetical protein [Saccharothrix ecbatanensis]